jgi:6-phosphofructokinase
MADTGDAACKLTVTNGCAIDCDNWLCTCLFFSQLMGRSSGFIAAHATLANGDVDLCLVPEMPVGEGE